MIVILLYYLLFLGVTAFSKFLKSDEVQRYFETFMCFILLFVFFGFRDITILNDTPHYYGFYYKLAHYNNYANTSIFAYDAHDRFEYGYQVFVHFLIKYVSKDPYTIIWVSSLIITVGNLWFINRHTKDVAFTVFAILILGSFWAQYCLIRQTLAMMVFYVAYTYLEKDRPWPFCLLVVAATLFHYTAVAMLVLPLLKRLKPNLRNVAIMLTTAVVIAVVLLKLMQALGLTNNLYFQQMMKRDNAPIAAIMDCAMMALLLLTCTYLHWRMRLQQIDRTYFWTGVFAMCVAIVTIVFLPLFRINTYLWPVIILMLLRYLSPSYQFREQAAENSGISQEWQLRKVLQMAVVIALLARSVVTMTFRPEWNHVVPYQFYDFSDSYHNYHLYWDNQ